MNKNKFTKWLYPGLGLKRWAILGGIALGLFTVGLWSMLNNRAAKDFTFATVRFLKKYMPDLTFVQGLFCAVIGLVVTVFCIVIIVSQYSKLTHGRSGLDAFYRNASLEKGPNIVVIGGGTGLSVLLRGLKNATHNLTATVTVGDDGGSSGRLREAFGVVPVGDVRNCIVALADEEQIMEKLFNYRFDGGDDGLKGHSLGNLLLLALTSVLESFQDAVANVDQILTMNGRVLPVTNVPLTLEAELEDGTFLTGECHVSEALHPIKKLDVYPKDAKVLPEVLEAIQNADAIILGPGSLYTSVIPNLCVDGVVEALAEAEATIFYTCNVATQPGETLNYTVSDHLQAILDHSEQKLIDYVIADDGKQVLETTLATYITGGSEPVVLDADKVRELGAEVISTSLSSKDNPYQHDSEKLARTIMFTLFYDRKYRKKHGYFSTYWQWQKYKQWVNEDELFN